MFIIEEVDGDAGRDCMDLLRESAIDFCVTVYASLSGGYVRTKITITIENYDRSNRYWEMQWKSENRHHEILTR